MAILTAKKNNFLLKNTPKGFTLELQPEFVLPKKVYGDLDSVVSRVLTTFKDESSNVGVLFSGIKGNSKTTTAKTLCIESGLSVIMITEPYTGADFKAFLSSLKQEVVIFIDEFEKVYHTDELQQEFLSILDGLFDKKKLFLFTSNSADINSYLRNRPSRIYYHFKYDNLESNVVDEIIENELEDKEFEPDLRAVLQILGSVSIDVLLKFIAEVNRFSKSPKELIKGMNIEIEQTNFSVIMIVNGERAETTCKFNPLVREEFFLTYQDEKGRHKWFEGNFNDYTMYTKGASFVYENTQNKLVFTPFKPFKFSL